MDPVQMDLARVDCAECGAVFYVSKTFDDTKRGNHSTFCCPAGHKLVYLKTKPSMDDVMEENKKLKSENLKLRHQLEQMEAKMSGR